MQHRSTTVICTVLAVAATIVQPRADDFQFNEKQKASKYLGTFQKWLETDAEATKARDAVLCVGSSSMRGWKTIKQDLAPLNVIHRGFGGSTMSEVVLFQDFFLRYEARTILIYEGDNDLNSLNYAPASFIAACKTFCDAVWALRPDTKFYFICIKPSPSRASKWKHQQAGNKLLQEFAADNANVVYIDVATPMLGDNGKPKPEIFVKDNLHMNSAGYVLWKKAVRDALIDK